MTKLEPAEDVVEEMVDKCVRSQDWGLLVTDVAKATALLEADRAAVREAALEPFRELLKRLAGCVSGAMVAGEHDAADAYRCALEMFRALLPPAPSSKGGSDG